MKHRVHVRLGSANAAKLRAVELGLAPFFDEVRVSGGEVASGVDEQPLGFDEIIAGARNRARASWALGTQDLAAGIEDGELNIPHGPLTGRAGNSVLAPHGLGALHHGAVMLGQRLGDVVWEQ